MVDTEVSLYTMTGHLATHHDMESSLLSKVDHVDQLKDLDHHSSRPVDSPRVSSTPPSTPGLDSIQDKEAKEDGDDDDEVEDLDDYRNTNYGYDEYLNDYESEPDEDYFFKDFAATTSTASGDNNAINTTRPKSKRYSRHRQQRSQKAMSRFDLQAFARQLHANRLSVLQTRQSRMILTEEDERELDKLLARKASYDSTLSLSTPPPVPALPPVPASSSLPPSTSSPLTTTTTTTAIDSQQNHDDPSPTDIKQKATVVEPKPDLAGPISRLSSDSLKKPSLLLQKLNDQHPSFRSNNASLGEVAPLSPSLSDPSSFTSPRRAPTPPSPSTSLSSSSTTTTTTTTTEKIHPPATTVTLSPAPVSFTLKKKSSWMSNHKLTKPQQKSASPLSAPQPRKSMSVDTLRDQTRQKESWKIAGTVKPVNSDSGKGTKAPITTVPPLSPATPAVLEDATKKPKLRLFGSLRQASRSSRVAGEGAIRGLMRNLSTVGQRQQQQQQQQKQPATQEQDFQQDATTSTTEPMSRAARAVIQHNVSTKKKPTNSSKKAHELDAMEGVDDTTVQVTHTATSAKGGVRLLSNLLAKAKARRSPSTKKTTNMSSDDATTTAAAAERNKVVRRTIIYVQPDALDFMKDGHLPPIPTKDARLSKDTLLDDTAEYATATKVTRQVSRRKRLVEDPEQHQPSLDDSNHKKWRLESVSELNVANNNNDDDNSLEGLELREMSDGSVVWGVVKKQGNRKSFFATLDDKMEPEDVERDQIEKSVLALMGLEPDSLDHLPARLSNAAVRPPPIPKRSPRRKCLDDNATEDSKRLQRGLSVEEQLDEMMLSIKQAHF